MAARSGGGTVRLRELASTLALVAPHHRYLFVVRREMEAAVTDRFPAAETLSPPPAFDRAPARVLWEQAWLPRVAVSWAPDIVFSPFNVLPVRWPEPRPKLAVIVSNLAPYAPEVRRMYRGKERLRLEALKRMTDRSLRHADRVFLLSAQAFDLIDSRVLDGRAEVIPMAPPRSGVGSTVEAPAGLFFVIVSDLLRYKGIELALDALAMLEGERPSLLVCGNALDGRYAARLRERADRLGVADRVRFLGSLDHRAVLGLFSSCIACIVPSRFENKSRVPVEAMAMGAPVIASDLVTFRESCGDTALYFDLAHPHPQLAEH
ncbi:MAG TPA: glycosyltransferase, partial [Actinomycetota bacterium]|nr:glycosyltransferase [Actinomycetota bacterium]